MRISDWSSDVFSSDLGCCYGSSLCYLVAHGLGDGNGCGVATQVAGVQFRTRGNVFQRTHDALGRGRFAQMLQQHDDRPECADGVGQALARSEEHTSELQSLMSISYAVFCLKKKTKRQQ